MTFALINKMCYYLIGTRPTNLQNDIQAITAPDFSRVLKALENCLSAKKFNLLFDASRHPCPIYILRREWPAA